jgi:hypothetical protein
MPKIYPFDDTTTLVQTLISAGFAPDPADPTKYTEALSFLLCKVFIALDEQPSAQSTKFPINFPDPTGTPSTMASEITSTFSAAGLPAIIGDLAPAVITPLLSWGLMFFTSPVSAYQWVGETILDNVLRFVLDVCLEHYKKAFIEGDPSVIELESTALEQRLAEIRDTLKAMAETEGLLEIDDVRIWTKSKLFEDV